MIHLRLNPLNRLAMCDEESAQITLSQIEFDEQNIDWSAEYRIEGDTLVRVVAPTLERTLDVAKQEKRMQIELAYTDACSNVAITISGTTVHYSFIAGNRTWNEAVAIQAAYGALPNSTPIALEFFGKDGSFVFTTAGAWKNFYNACVSAYGTHGQKRAQKNALINTATTIAEVDAITWG